MSKKFQAVEYSYYFIGSRYQWTGEGPFNMGFDCSGLILEVLRSIGLWGKEDATAQMIYDKFKLQNIAMALPRPDLGMLVFFGKSNTEISHIGLMVNNYQYIEAGGGDSKTVDKGMVRIRPLTWRKDLVSFLDIIKD